MSHRRLHLRLLIAGFVLSLIASACGSVSSDTVKIAVSFPQGIEIGKDMVRGAQMAFDEAKGKAGRYNVVLIISDSSDPKGSPVSNDFEIANAKNAIADSGIVAYLGTATSGQARSVMALLNAAQMTEVAPSTTWPGLTKPGFGAGEPGIYYPTGRRHFFRLVPSDEVQGLVAAKWIVQLGAKSVYIISDGSPYGEGLAGIFEANAPDQKLKVLGHDRYDPAKAQPDEVKALAAKIVAAKPDALYYPANLQGDFQLMVEVRALEPKILIMGGDGLVGEDVSSQAKPLEGIYATNTSLDADQLDSASTFLKNFQAAYGKKPPAFAMVTYESMKVLLKAIERADSPTREAVLNAMGKLGDFTGVLGTWHFDDNGDINQTAISGLQFQNGQWKTITVIR